MNKNENTQYQNLLDDAKVDKIDKLLARLTKRETQSTTIKSKRGTFLMVQWLRLIPKCKRLRFNPWSGN